MPRLVIVNGAEAGRALELEAPELVIGRATGTQLRLEGPKVSRRHAGVLCDTNGFRVEDLGSSNGTFVNGKKLQTPVALRSGDEIGIGAYLLRYEGAGGSPELTIHARSAASTANAHLYQGDAANKLKIILQLSADLSRSLDIGDLLGQVLDHLFLLFPQAERGLVIFLGEDGPILRAQKQRGALSQAPRFSATVVQQVASEGVGILAEDAQLDSRFGDAQSIVSLGVRSFICVPLQTRGTKALGVLQLERTGGGHPFTSEDLNLLTAIGLQVAVAVSNAQLHEELIGRQRIQDELALAREIQLSYLPTEVPEFAHKNFEVYAELHPANEISGDFYDYFRMGGDRLAITVGDVCGKGIPAALFMSMVRALLRSLAERQADPGILLHDLNNAVAQQNPKGQFVTLSFCVFDPGARTLDIASAGHPSPLIRRANGSVETVTLQHGPVLGFMEGSKGYAQMRCQMNPGELLLLYTDGVTEAPGANEKMFGPERLRASLEAAPFPPQLGQWTQSLRKAIQTFTGSRAQEDDITLALLRVG